jgi:hypothetical protein
MWMQLSNEDANIQAVQEVGMADTQEYHVERARAEMDLAYRADSRPSADAHMKLAALHMARAKELDERCNGSGCREPGWQHQQQVESLMQVN